MFDPLNIKTSAVEAPLSELIWGKSVGMREFSGNRTVTFLISSYIYISKNSNITNINNEIKYDSIKDLWAPNHFSCSVTQLF